MDEATCEWMSGRLKDLERRMNIVEQNHDDLMRLRAAPAEEVVEDEPPAPRRKGRN